jgi:hypothetical protein
VGENTEGIDHVTSRILRGGQLIRLLVSDLPGKSPLLFLEYFWSIGGMKIA